jgi:hypothetical protein
MKLMFNNPRFERGLNVTVRLGSKWNAYYYGNRSVDTFKVELATSEGETIGHGKIEYVELRYFTDIPPTILELEHDPACRNLRGLYDELKKAYGETFTVRSTVSVVYFTVD